MKKERLRALAEEYAQQTEGCFEYAVSWDEVVKIFEDGAKAALDKLHPCDDIDWDSLSELLGGKDWS